MAELSNRDPEIQDGVNTFSLNLLQSPHSAGPKYYPISIGDEVEPIEFYKTGGYCPIQIGDVLDDRFEVFHKLGYGGIATVWLCYEFRGKQWRAIKINAADFSAPDCADLHILEAMKTKGVTNDDLEGNHIALPLETFWKESPNGQHLCSVLPVLGPKLSDWRETMGNDQRKVNQVCKQLAVGLKLLHDHGICHGDFRPQNILMKLDAKGLNKISKEEMAKLLIEPDIEDILTISGDKSPNAPEFAVAALKWDDLKGFISSDVAIVDFGEAFEAWDPPQKLGIPERYAAPEVLFDDGQFGFASDIWALGCTLLAIKMDTFTGMDLWDVIRRMEYFSGPLPPRCRSKARMMLYEQKVRRCEKGILKKKPKPPALDICSEEELKPVTGKKMTSIEAEWAEDSKYTDPIEIYLGSEQFHFGEGCGSTEMPSMDVYRLPQQEVIPLADLLRKMLRYDPKERLKLSEVIRHEWFIGKDEGASSSKPLLRLQTGLTEALWLRSLLAAAGVVLIAVGLATLFEPLKEVSQHFLMRFCESSSMPSRLIRGYSSASRLLDQSGSCLGSHNVKIAYDMPLDDC